MRPRSLLTLLAIIVVFAVFQGSIIVHRYWDPRSIDAEQAAIFGTSIKVGTPVSGTVTEVLVEENQTVKLGQPLVKVLPQSPVKPTGGQVYIITASRQGVVSELTVEKGTFVRSDEIVAKIYNSSSDSRFIHAEIPVLPEEAYLIHPGRKAVVSANFLGEGEDLMATIFAIDPSYNAKDETVSVRLRFNESIESFRVPYEGLPVAVRVQMEESSALQRIFASVRSTFVPSIQASH